MTGMENFYNGMDATMYAFDNKINYIKESPESTPIHYDGRKKKDSRIPKGTYDDMLQYDAEEGDLFAVGQKTYKYTNGKWTLVMNYLVGTEEEKEALEPYEGLKFYQNSDDPAKRGEFVYSDGKWNLTEWIGTQEEYNALAEINESTNYYLIDAPAGKSHDCTCGNCKEM